MSQDTEHPFTEHSNPITVNIDICNSREIVNLLQQTDYEIFSGVNTENLFNPNVLDAITKVSNLICTIIQEHTPQDVAVVLAGCGTSGRLAFLVSRICNELSTGDSRNGPFHFSIAGGEKSILTSQEAPEDDYLAGEESLSKICHGKRRVVYIGITCGLSAPFVGGQLGYCMKHLDIFTPVLLGFNPISMARNVPIAGWDKTMRDVAMAMEKLSRDGKAYVINPVLGAEAITGSSRMKGGSCTLIILEVMLLSALQATKDSNLSSIADITAILKLYENICRDFYESEAGNVMSTLIERAGDSLINGAGIRYLASGWNGVLAIIDSTECPPTYGSSVNDVRGFIPGGYDFLGISDFGQENSFFKLGIDDFSGMYENSTNNRDTIVVFIQSPEDPLLVELRRKEDVLKRLKGFCSITAVLLQSDEKIVVSDLQDCFTDIHRIKLPNFNGNVVSKWEAKTKKALANSLYGCCFKWLLNAVSTGAHILLGKVYKNFMADVKVSNSKLYHRAIEMIRKFCDGLTYDEAKEYLLKSIYELDELTPSIRSGTVYEHHVAATSKDKVVPMAIILATSKCSVDGARDILSRHNVVRNAIVAVAQK